MINTKDEVTSHSEGGEEAGPNKVGEPRETIKYAHSLSASGQLRAYFITTKLINRSVQGPATAAGERRRDRGGGAGGVGGEERRKEGRREADGGWFTQQEVELNSQQHFKQLLSYIFFLCLILYGQEGQRILQIW